MGEQPWALDQMTTTAPLELGGIDAGFLTAGFLARGF